MTGRRLIAIGGLAVLATLGLTACNRDVAQPEVVVVDPRVAQVDSLDIGRSPGGWIVTARARDPRGSVERLSFAPVQGSGGVLRFDLIGTLTERMAPGLGTPQEQSALAAVFIPDADLVGIAAIEVRATNGSLTIAVPQRIVAE